MTLHVRMVSPPDQTELLAAALIADSGVSNLVVLTGSARRPDGDAVYFDVHARSANSVLLVRAEGRLTAVTQTDTPVPQAGDTIVFLGPVPVAQPVDGRSQR